MKEYTAIREVNPDQDCGLGYGISLLPYSLSSDKLIAYIKTRFNLTDAAFNQLLIKNCVRYIDSDYGSLKIDNYIIWYHAIAEKESKSGNYLGLMNDFDCFCILIPKDEDLLHNLKLWLKIKSVGVSDDVIYAAFADKDYLDDNDNIDIPHCGSIHLKDTEFYWDMCRIEQ